MRRLLLLICLLTPSSSAFASVPPLNVHGDITRAAAEAAGWPGDVEALVKVVVAVDLDEMTWDPSADQPEGIRLKDDYDPAHHCDRVGPGHAEAFSAAGAYIRQRRDDAIAARDPGGLTQATGQALHALQDCFSHTDFVDLPAMQQEAFVQALLEGAPAPPIRVGAVDPAAETPGDPADPYPHDAINKDYPDANAESRAPMGNGTKFEAAREAAIAASTTLLTSIMAAADPDTLRQAGKRDAPAASLVLLSAGCLLLAGADRHFSGRRRR